ncbi:MAG TPA: T9SS type A sorting domain-containing protein, partial [Puia sp.]|nr:T9SS type A sorting domain-containing protein [Puia sp.]
SIGQTHVQTTTLFQTSTAANIAKAFTASSTTGNLIVVHLDWDGQTRSITSVTDNKGNSYTRINGPTNWNGPNYRAELWYAYNITGGGAAITVTGHLSGAPISFSQIYISEYSGIVTANPLEQNAVATGNSAAVSSGAKTTTYTNELIYGASIGASGVLTVGGGFTSRSTANSNIVEDKNAAAIGSYNAAFTSASGNWVAQMATFISTSSLHILPIELLSFTAQCNHGQINLTWITASESNNDYFSIERSADGEHWNPIGTVKGVGNSSVNQTYSFTTDQTTDATSYFRLKQADLDGKLKYFNIVRVNPCDEDLTGLSIYPNPSNGRSLHGRIHLKSTEAYSIVIFDRFGKLVSRFESVLPEFNINFLQVLQPGVYYARFTSAGFSKVKSFLVSD